MPWYAWQVRTRWLGMMSPLPVTQTQFVPLHLRIAAQDLVRRRGHVYSRLRSAASRRPERARGSRRRQQRSSKRDKRPHSQMAARACDAATKSRCECLCGQLEAWDADQVHKMPFISSGAGVAAARLSDVPTGIDMCQYTLVVSCPALVRPARHMDMYNYECSCGLL
jgi:hypothetical protein